MAHYSAVVAYEEFPQRGSATLWRMGWLAYRGAEFPLARVRFQQMIAREEDPLVRLRPEYWAARAAERSGARVLANRELREIAETYPNALSVLT